ncbi:MAG: hypothetical protein ACMG6E_08390 [Candidatus Roizmanbacteria bacterium]
MDQRQESGRPFDAGEAVSLGIDVHLWLLLRGRSSELLLLRLLLLVLELLLLLFLLLGVLLEELAWLESFAELAHYPACLGVHDIDHLLGVDDEHLLRRVAERALGGHVDDAVLPLEGALVEV